MTTPEDILLTATGISKRFGITQALDNVSVSFRAGEVHALMGENGAGKSTLGKTIAGLHRPDTGEVRMRGQVIEPGSIDAAFAAGVRIVHQELAQCPNLSVAENLSLHAIPRNRMGWVDFKAMRKRAEELVHKLEPGIDVAAMLGSLTPGRRQIVQIASSLDEGHGAAKPQLIVFDEPTSSLSVAETDRLLEIIRHLASTGITCVYVSHRMGEIFAVCDRVTVLRDGKFVATSEIKAIDEPILVEQMIGRKVEIGAKRTPPAPSQVASLEVRGLSSDRGLANVSLRVSKGEVLGIGGLVGSGRSELLDAIFGLDATARASITVEGASVPANNCRAMIAARVGYVPEDRKLQGLFFEMGVDENIVMPFMARLSHILGLRSASGEKDVVSTKVGDFRVKTASTSSRPGELSGGNQQKLLLARWMGKDTRVLLLDEPTRGIDIGTKTEVHRLIRQAADAGTAVIVVSSEMPELLALSDRIIVMADGQIAGELTGDSMTQTSIMNLATQSRPVASPGQ